MGISIGFVLLLWSTVSFTVFGLVLKVLLAVVSVSVMKRACHAPVTAHLSR